MVARVLRLSLAFELLFWALLVGYAARQLGWSDPQAAAALLALMLGLRAGFIAVTFAYGWTYRSPRSPGQRIGPLATLGMMLKEYLAFVALFVVIQPFERWFLGRERLRRAGAQDLPVLLVHGYGCNRGVWWRLRRRLQRAGMCVATVDLEPTYTGIDDYVEPLRQRIEAVCRETGAERLVLVAHSMGGLVCRAYLARHGAARVAKLVTLGTPHQGSEIARIGLGRNARQMEPDSPWLRGLAEQNVPKGVEATVIYSVHDNFVMPQDLQRLAGWKHRAVIGMGHLAMVLSPRIADDVANIVRGTGRPRDAGL